jgi:cytochrome c-type biogenesis protein
MFDPVTQGLAAVSTRSPYAPALVFAAGAVTSIGPCVAPRFIAVAGLAAGKSRRDTAILVAAFIGGLTTAYAAFGAASSLLGRAAQFSTYTYAALAIVLAAGGCVTLWREERVCAHTKPSGCNAGAGGALLLGASFALVLSPCCTPVVLGILAYTSAVGSVAYGSALLACYALGHALPIVAVASGMRGVTGMLRRNSVRQAAAVVSGTLMLALAAFYAVSA